MYLKITTLWTKVGLVTERHPRMIIFLFLQTTVQNFSPNMQNVSTLGGYRIVVISWFAELALYQDVQTFFSREPAVLQFVHCLCTQKKKGEIMLWCFNKLKKHKLGTKCSVTPYTKMIP